MAKVVNFLLHLQSLVRKSNMESVRINTSTGASSIVYVRNSFDDLFSILKGKGEVVLIIDKNVNALYGELFPYKKIIIEASEKNKSLTTVSNIISKLISMEIGRDTFLLGVGGGITSDITGFVASIYKRGVNFAYVATSLLSQVDAAIGGKTGVNYEGYKNIVGTIIQPEFTFVNVSVLSTLPEREFSAGLSEMLKSFIIADKTSYSGCIEFFKRSGVSARLVEDKEKSEELGRFILSSIKIKRWIVERDELEHGERRLLNLGHTFGHAIEKCLENEQNILHGEAVSMGIIIAAKISENLNLLPKETLKQLTNDFISLGLPVEHNIKMDKLLDAIKNDKKREGDFINFVLIQNIGQAFVRPLSLKELEDIVYDLY